MLVGADSYVRYLIKLTWPRAETKKKWCAPRSERLFWAQNFGFWSKNPIFAIRPQFWLMTHF